MRFLAVFKGHLGVSATFSADELEEALVAAPGDCGLLAELHADLLAGVGRARGQARPAPGQWAGVLRGRLEGAGLQVPGFKPSRGREAQAYAALSSASRVLALKALCDVRADCEDLREALEAALRSKGPQQEPRAALGSQRGGGVGPAPLDPAVARGWEPMGTDSAGCSWFLLDAPPALDVRDEATGIVATRLYRECPPQPLKSPGKGAVRSGGGSSAHSAGTRADSEEDTAQEAGETQQQQQQQQREQQQREQQQDQQQQQQQDRQQQQQQEQQQPTSTKEAPGAESGRSRPSRGSALLASTRIQAQAKGAINVWADPAPSKRQKAAAKPPKSARRGGAAAAPGDAAPPQRFEVGPDPFPLPGDWSLAADGLDAIRALGASLAGRRGRADRDIGARVLGDVVPLLEERQEAAEKLHRARARVARTLGLGAAGLDAGEDARARRARAATKAVDYTAYDRAIAALIREHDRVPVSSGGGSDSEAPAGPRGLPSYTEEQLAQLRRGRSARGGDGGSAPPGQAAAALDVGGLERAARKRQRERRGGPAGGGASQAPAADTAVEEKENSGGRGVNGGSGEGGKGGALSSYGGGGGSAAAADPQQRSAAAAATPAGADRAAAAGDGGS